MARKKTNVTRPTRSHYPTTTPIATRPRVLGTPTFINQAIYEYGDTDWRTYSPTPKKTAAIRKRDQRITVDTRGDNIRKQNVSPWLTFTAPANVLTCVRRKIRKRVFNAFKLKRGRGRGRKTALSHIRC